MFKFTKYEVRDLIISFLVISFGFAILYSNRNFSALEFFLPIAMVGVGTGFILHEIAHKLSSMHYGYWAEYKLWTSGLIIALVSSLFGFIFAAPGAVYTYGTYIDEKQNGIISLSGPVTNIILAIIFLILSIIVYISYVPGDIINQILFLTFSLGFSINSYLATFNLIPIWNLDGSKVLRWNGLVWVTAIAISGIMTYLSMFVGTETIIKILLGI
ncbi:MAG: site-2 protease family protein [Methanobrevibacter sp.]|jgi:Zn-dependent protease|nr:site-2 protease family protein [Methanobrevibacter sp.]